MNNYKTLGVFLDGKKVGTLASMKNHLVAFEYDKQWIETGFSISPISLPLQAGVFVPKDYDPFEGLFGVFSDSLPDGWGRLLVDRMLARQGINPASVDSLNRLAIVGNSGMGALEYQPENKIYNELENLSLDEIARECKRMFETQTSKDLDTLFQMGGSSGGARPKVFYRIDEEDWIVKFPSSIDVSNIGKQEYEYSICAAKCGLDIPKTKLIPSEFHDGYFAVKRFDRLNGKKRHMISASALLETSHRIPNLDYNILMKLTMNITKNYEEVEKMYRLMCFNVFAHNRDDHSKNFSFIYDDGWKLSPAYDLTYSNSIGGEHATTVNGNGSNPGLKDLLQVAKNCKLDEKWAKETAEEIQQIVEDELKIKRF